MTTECSVCGKPFETARSSRKTCSELCRKRKQRGGEPVSAPLVTTTVGAVRAELEAVGRVDTFLGAAALALAERIDASTAVMGFAALVKELRSTMDAATAGVTIAADPLDELRSRRERKLDAG